MMLDEIIHSSPDKFVDRDCYYNFKRNIQAAQQCLQIAGRYLPEQTKAEWGIQIDTAKHELDRFVFED